MFAIFVKAVLISGLLATTTPADPNAKTIGPVKPTVTVTVTVSDLATPSTTTEASTDNTTAPVDPLDLLSKAEGFYNDRMTDLLWTMGILMGIGAVIIPLVVSGLIQWQRKISFAKELSKLKDELQEIIDTRIESAIKILENRQDELWQKSDKRQSGAIGNTSALFGYNFVLTKDWSSAIDSYLTAAFYLLDYGDFKGAKEQFPLIKSIIQGNPQWYKNKDDYNRIIDALIDLQQQNNNIDADTGCDKIIQEIKELIIKPPDQQQAEPQPPES